MAQEEVKRRGLLKKHAAVDYEVWKWKTNLEQSRPTQHVTKTEVQAYAVKAYKDAGINTFKASDGWYRRWRVRWTQPGIIKHKESKGREDFKKKNKSYEVIENSCETDNNVGISRLLKYDYHSTLKLNGILKESSSKTDDKIIQFDRKTENKEDCSNILNKSQVNGNHTLNINKLIQRQASKMSSSNSVSFDVNKVVEEIQLKSEESDFYLLRDNSVSNLTNETLLKTNLSNATSNMNSKKVAENEHNEPTVKDFTLQNVCGNTLDNADNLQVKYSDHIPSSVLEKNSKAHEEHRSTINASAMLSNCMNSESYIGLQCSDGISSPSTSLSLETFTIDSPLLVEGDFEFGDHEFFCDFCEDFHPRQKHFGLYCCKHKEDSSFLKSVFEKKDLNTITDPPSNNSSEEKATKKTINESIEDNKLINPSVLFPKGKRYLLQFKSKVVNYALNHNATQAATMFKVNRGTVSEWLDEHRRSSSCGTPKSKLIKGLSLPDDKEFLSWLESSKFNLTNELMKQKAEEWLQLEGASISRCEWLRMYANRLNGTEDGSIKKRYITYPEAFKRMVVFHAQTHSNMAAARVFAVSRRRVMQWQEMINDAKVKNVASASNVTDEAVDNQVFEWFSSQDPPPSSRQVRAKGLELYNAAGYNSIQCGAQWYYRWRARHKLPPARDQLHKEVPLLSWVLTQLDNNQCVTHVELTQTYNSLTNSKVSRGWTFRFCRKYYKLLQSIPDPSTSLPLSLERQVKGFLKTLHESIQNTGYKETDIIVMDEVPLHFLPQDNTKKPLLIRRSGFESCQASLIVSSLADGTLLPTMFVFKGVAPSSESDSCVVAVANDSGLVSEDTMTLWLSNICSNQLQGHHGLLITDCFDAHTSKCVQEVMAEYKVHHAVIPGGCGFKLSPISKLCQLFKSMLEDMCQVSLTNQTTALSSPSPDQLYIWSVRVHKHLAKYQKENIKIAFKDMKILPGRTVL